MALIEVSSDFAYVIVTVILSFFLLFWLSMNVGLARKKYNVKYPAMYSDTCPTFNCIQRAHQNTLEYYPMFITALVVGGIYHPKLCAVGAVIWLLGRVVYAKGYYTGEPANRNRGVFAYIGFLILLVSNACFAFHLFTSGQQTERNEG